VNPLKPEISLHLTQNQNQSNNLPPSFLWTSVYSLLPLTAQVCHHLLNIMITSPYSIIRLGETDTDTCHIEWMNGIWVWALPGPMHLHLKWGPLCPTVAHPGIFFLVCVCVCQQIQLRTDGRKNGDQEAVAP
jgi:hypothetical protein